MKLDLETELHRFNLAFDLACELFTDEQRAEFLARLDERLAADPRCHWQPRPPPPAALPAPPAARWRWN